jgi:hypothetical protein
MKSISRGTSRVLASTALAVGIASVSVNAEAIETQTVIVTASIPTSSGSFDNFMTSYFGSSGNYSNHFDAPEGEAYYVQGFGSWIKKLLTPEVAITLDVCGLRNVTAQSKSTTGFSMAEERGIAAHQVFFGNLPNFSSVNKAGILIQIKYSDGATEDYKKIGVDLLEQQDGTLKLGNGIPRC